LEDALHADMDTFHEHLVAQLLHSAWRSKGQWQSKAIKGLKLRLITANSSNMVTKFH